MEHDAFVSPAVLSIIMVGYGLFAGTIWWRLWCLGAFWRRCAIPAHLLAAVFALCAFTGYGSGLLPDGWLWVRDALHSVLAAIVLPLCVTRIPDAVAGTALRESD